MDDVNSLEPDNFRAENRLFERILREVEETPEMKELSPLSKARKNARVSLGQNITKNQIITFTEENYRNELGGEIVTPIGNVKMSDSNWGRGTENSFQKMDDKSRQDNIFKTKQSLTDPSIIIKVKGYTDRYIYAKVFDDSSLAGKERQVFYSVVDNGLVISNFNRDHLRIRDFTGRYITSPESLIWLKNAAPSNS
jgi:hypothetical protein